MNGGNQNAMPSATPEKKVPKFSPNTVYLGSAEKVFRWGLGCGVLPEKVPEFSPQSLQGSALFEVKKV